jgi:Na+/melibiose symporter-like transporter
VILLIAVFLLIAFILGRRYETYSMKKKLVNKVLSQLKEEDEAGSKVIYLTRKK